MNGPGGARVQAEARGDSLVSASESFRVVVNQYKVRYAIRMPYSADTLEANLGL